MIRTLPLSQYNELYEDNTPELETLILPIGSGYKKYLDVNKLRLSNYTIVVNTHDEVNIHFIKDKMMELSDSVIIPEYSLEYLLENFTPVNSILISKVIDIQLKIIMDEICSRNFNNYPILYLENTTDYINYLNKKDSLLLSDRYWKQREVEYLLQI